MAKGLEHLSFGGCLRELWLLSMEKRIPRFYRFYDIESP